MDTAEDLLSLLPACTVTYGWHLSGPGPARHGWGARTASGLVEYLGKTKTEARSRAKQLGSMFGT